MLLRFSSLRTLPTPCRSLPGGIATLLLASTVACSSSPSQDPVGTGGVKTEGTGAAGVGASSTGATSTGAASALPDGGSPGSGATAGTGGTGATAGVGGGDTGAGGSDQTGGAGPGDPQGPTFNPSPTAIWYLVQPPAGGLALAGTAQGDQVELPPIEGVDPRNGYFPWSPDGTMLAQIVDGSVVFYQLTDSWQVLASFPAGPYERVYTWIPGVGPLLTGGQGADSVLGAMTPEGNVFVLGDLAPRTGVSTAMVAPDGSEVVWAFAQEVGGYTVWHQSFDNGQPGETAQIGSYDSPAPILSNLWSFDSNWLAFGLSGNVGSSIGGTYLWRRGMDTIQMVSLGDNVYTPYFSFSSDSQKFAMHLSSDESGVSGLAIVLVSDNTIEDTNVLLRGEGVSPAQWSRHGSYLMYEVAGHGYVQEIGQSADPQPPLDFPDYRSSCAVRWFSDSEFVANGCNESDALTFGTIEDGALSTTDVPGLAREYIILSQDDRCLVGWSGAGAYIGKVKDVPFAPQDVPNGGGDVDWVQLSPDGSQLVWVENSLVEYSVEVVDCAVQGQPVKVAEFESPISTMDFLVYYDR